MLGSCMVLFLVESALQPPCNLCMAQLPCVLKDASCRLSAAFEHLLSPVQSKLGEAKLGQLCEDGDLHVGELFKADPELDPEDIPDAPAFLKQQGLSVVPL